MDKYKNLADKFKALNGDVEKLLDIFNSEEFKALAKEWGKPKAIKNMPDGQIDYINEIAEYTVTAIELYENAVKHETISLIELHFYQASDNDTIQPQIDIQFDSGLYHIDIGMFWDDDIGLEREFKKNCQSMEETIWVEYNESNSDKDITFLAESVRNEIAKKYPKVTVQYKID